MLGNLLKEPFSVFSQWQKMGLTYSRTVISMVVYLLFHLSENGHFDICKLIIDNVDDTNRANNEGFTPLHKAAHLGRFDICKLIFDNVDTKNPAKNNGKTPLYIAVQNGHFDICRLVINNVTTRIQQTTMVTHLFT